MQQRMTVRDDEDLAIEQLAPAGHAGDPELTGAGAGEPVQEEAARRAEPVVADQGILRLIALREGIQRLRCQRDALPVDQLAGSTRSTLGGSTSLSATGRARSSSLACRSLPHRGAAAKDPDLAARVRLRSILGGLDAQRGRLSAERARLVRELGDPEQVRAFRVRRADVDELLRRASADSTSLATRRDVWQRTTTTLPARRDPDATRTMWDPGAAPPPTWPGDA